MQFLLLINLVELKIFLQCCFSQHINQFVKNHCQDFITLGMFSFNIQIIVEPFINNFSTFASSPVAYFKSIRFQFLLERKLISHFCRYVQPHKMLCYVNDSVNKMFHNKLKIPF